jgi:hypothetical protein
MLDNHKYRSAHNKISSPLFPVLVSKWYPLTLHPYISWYHPYLVHTCISELS